MSRVARVLTWSAPGRLDGRIAVAGGRAGALGALDLGREFDPRAVNEAFARVGRLLKSRPFGARAGADEVDRALAIPAPENLGVMIVTGGPEDDWAGLERAIRRAGRLAMAEVTTPEAAAEAFAAGFLSLIVTSPEAGLSPGLLRNVLGLAPEKGRVWVRGGIGPDTAASCVAEGAAGVVLDEALRFTRESSRGEPDQGEGLTDQDNSMAGELARRFVTVGGIVAEVERAIEEKVAPAGASPKRRKRVRPSDVAIVGMAAVVPGATEVRQFWENTLAGRDAITEVPADRWDWRLYYDPDPKAPDKISSRWGGFLPEIAFDPLQYGMPPASLTSIEPLHLIALEVVRAALDDAGYGSRPFPRERTAVVLGAGGGAAQLAMGYAFRSYLPMLDTVLPGAGADALAACANLLPEWTEDSFPGILLNVAAGRIANRFDLGGANYTVDAACGSSLAAAALAVRELESGAADMVILGGADTVQNPFTYLAFSKTHAFSPRGRCRPFDDRADGIVISEGVAVVVLKRLADAERDGDRIYSVIKGVGASSDGREKSLTAPRYEGQVRALRRAYEKAGVSPTSVGYVEAHGTGTVAGDQAEVNALKDVFGAAGAARNGCALGSVKSLIGHTKCAAGLAGLINASLALHHRVLPPTIGIETPNPRVGFADSPFHLSTRARPWLGASADRPRRAGVSAFGFGGTNFHAVLEAYEGGTAPRCPAVIDRPAELFVWRAPDRAGLLESLGSLDRALAGGPVPALRDLAHALTLAARETLTGPSLAIVATSAGDLREKARRARVSIASGVAELSDPSGIAFAENGSWAGARTAFLFPGQGAQSPDMLGELALLFPELIDAFEAFDSALAARGRLPIGPVVFPPPARVEAEIEQQKALLASPENSQPAIGAASVGLHNLLSTLGLRPDALAGHSYGELVALHAAGVFPLDALAELSEARGRFLLAAVGEEPGTMLAIQAGAADVAPLLEGVAGVVVANLNGPSQTVVSGTRDGIAEVAARARERGLRARALNVARGFHSPFVAPARKPLIELAAGRVAAVPDRPVYSNVTARPYPAEIDSIPRQLGDHLTSPVRFSAMLEAMHDDGVRVFVEVGPGSVLTGLAGSVLKGRAHLALACEPTGKAGLTGLLATLGRLFVAGLPIDLRPLTAGRSTQRVVVNGDRFEPTGPTLPPSAWMVDGNRARPAFGPEPPRFGHGPALEREHHPGRNGHAADHRLAFSTNGHAKPHAPEPDSRSRAVLAAFQQTMQTFLDVQQSTMLGFLASAGPPTGPPAPEPATTNGHLPHADHATNGHVAPPTPPPTPEPAAVLDVERRLREIVAERTGYPLEMLLPDLDLEADLGIDSIKRVEILGTLRDALPAARDGAESELMEQLSRARTLGAIVEHVSRHLSAGVAFDSGGPPTTPDVAAPSRSRVRRMVLEAVEAPLPASEGVGSLPRGGLVLITDDARGVAEATASRLRGQGFRTARLVHSSGPLADPDAFAFDFTSPDSVSRAVDGLRSEAPLVGLVHAFPLRDAAEAGLDPDAWAGRMGPEVRGLFLLAKACGDDLAKAAKRGGAGLVAATGMGGAFASRPDAPADFFAGHGAIAGLVKTLAREWDAVRARVVDLDPREAPGVLGRRLADEVLSADRRSEVGYRQGRRVALRPIESVLPTSPREPVIVRPGEPILITGGARGITASVALDLARRWRPTLLLAGTSPLPEDDDPADVAGLNAPAELKARLLERSAREGRNLGPADLERAYQALRRAREIRVNLRALRAAGATVDYARVDVRDGEAFRAVLAGWRERYGPPVGVIHGAGVIQDKLLRDKAPDSFDRVIGTKLDGALTLARSIDPAPLRFAAFFSSVAGRFGNRGQADYAAANDALNKLAVWLDRRWPCRVVSMIWGPWSGVGMVSDLEDHLGRQGLGMIAPEDGQARLGDELTFGAKGDVEVIVAGDLGNLVEPTDGGGQS